MAVVTPIGRFSFLNVFKPKERPGKDPRFELCLLFPKDTDLSALKEAAKKAVADKWADKPPKGLKSPFRDGDEMEYDGFEGTTFIRAWSYEPPGVVDGRRQVIAANAGRLKSGDYGRVSVRPFAYDKDGNKGVAFYLENVQKSGDGDALGAAAREDAADTFGELEGEDNFAEAAALFE